MLLCQGEIALAFGDLLRKLWAPGASPVAPRTFKSKLARFAPQFSGYNQHDSQVSASCSFIPPAQPPIFFPSFLVCVYKLISHVSFHCLQYFFSPQELLAFLLDGLHEDLNRVKHKPYIEAKDADDRPDEEVADEYWHNHLARNNSIIVDVCQVCIHLIMCKCNCSINYLVVLGTS